MKEISGVMQIEDLVGTPLATVVKEGHNLQTSGGHDYLEISRF